MGYLARDLYRFVSFFTCQAPYHFWPVGSKRESRCLCGAHVLVKQKYTFTKREVFVDFIPTELVCQIS